MSVPALTIELRLENDQVGNTWFSNAARDGEPDIQMHMDREVWIALGAPSVIDVSVRRKGEQKGW